MSLGSQAAVRDQLREGAARLAARYEGARLDAEVLLAHVLEVPRARLHARPERVIDDERIERYLELVARRAAGEPIAHLVGRREFWSIELEVSRATLIPRPETELLVEAALACMPAGDACRVADLGTGCGAIAIAIASERERASVLATDASEAALEVAARNVARLVPGDVRLRRGDWCAPLDGESFDVVVSNPPYVREGDAHLDQGDVAFEPREALVAGADGLDAIRVIARDARAHLRPGATLALEHGHDQGRAVRELLAWHGYAKVQTHVDLAGHERVATARWPGAT